MTKINFFIESVSFSFFIRNEYLKRSACQRYRAKPPSAFLFCGVFARELESNGVLAGLSPPRISLSANKNQFSPPTGRNPQTSQASHGWDPFYNFTLLRGEENARDCCASPRLSKQYRLHRCIYGALPFKTLNVHWEDIVENQRLDEAV